MSYLIYLQIDIDMQISFYIDIDMQIDMEMQIPFYITIADFAQSQSIKY